MLFFFWLNQKYNRLDIPCIHFFVVYDFESANLGHKSAIIHVESETSMLN